MTRSRIACGLWEGCQQGDGLHDPWCPASGQLVPPVDPAEWTPEQAQAAQAELDELERTDPDVAAAAASYDRMVERMNARMQHRDHVHAPLLNSPASAESTKADLEVARSAIAHEDLGWATALAVAERVAAALASQRAEIVARYEKVADQLTDAARATDSTLARSVLASSVLAIREAAPK